MKSRRIVAIVMISLGVVLFAVFGLEIMVGGPMVDWIVPLAMGVILFVVGIALFVTELFETWLSRGQRALVDGLQAG